MRCVCVLSAVGCPAITPPPGINKLLLFVPAALLCDWLAAPDWLIFTARCAHLSLNTPVNHPFHPAF